MSIKAKFHVDSVTKFFSNPESQEVSGIQLTMSAVTQGEGNKEWSRWTPSGTLSMNITNPAVFAQFQGGEQVYLTIEKAA